MGKEEILGKGTPTEDKEKPQAVESVEILTRLTSLEKDVTSLTTMVKFVKETNWFLIAVFTVGFIALVVTAIFTFASSFSDKSKADDNLSKDRYQLQQTEIDFLLK